MTQPLSAVRLPSLTRTHPFSFFSWRLCLHTFHAVKLRSCALIWLRVPEILISRDLCVVSVNKSSLVWLLGSEGS